MTTPFTESLAVHKLKSQGRRDDQQDSFNKEILETQALFVLADGMGGHAGGAIASRTVTAEITEYFPEIMKENADEDDLGVHRRNGPKSTNHWRLSKLFDYGAEALKRARKENPKLDPRTTCVATLFEGDEIFIANTGDSRCFIIRANGEIWHTVDHSIARMLVVTGEITEDEAQHHPDRNKLYRSLTDGGEDADFYTHPALQTGDALILCSDGFWEYLKDDELRRIASDKDIDDLLEEYIEIILERAGERADNISALIVRPNNMERMPGHEPAQLKRALQPPASQAHSLSNSAASTTKTYRRLALAGIALALALATLAIFMWSNLHPNSDQPLLTNELGALTEPPALIETGKDAARGGASATVP